MHSVPGPAREHDPLFVWLGVVKTNGASRHRLILRIGSLVALDGNIAVIGTVWKEAAYVFVRDAFGEWTELAKLLASDGAAGNRFGWSVAMDGDTAMIGAHEDDDHGSLAGSAYAFRLIRSGPLTSVPPRILPLEPRH